MTSRYQAKRNLLQNALSYLASDMYTEDHPENPNGDAEMEMKDELLLDAARKFVEAHTS